MFYELNQQLQKKIRCELHNITYDITKQEYYYLLKKIEEKNWFCSIKNSDDDDNNIKKKKEKKTKINTLNNVK